jgi:hypothetical protein
MDYFLRNWSVPLLNFLSAPLGRREYLFAYCCTFCARGEISARLWDVPAHQAAVAHALCCPFFGVCIHAHERTELARLYRIKTPETPCIDAALCGFCSTAQEFYELRLSPPPTEAPGKVQSMTRS